MADKLKIFISEHKASFDTLEPSAQLWAGINAGLAIKNGFWIKSKSLAKFLKLGFGASVLVTTSYVVLSGSTGDEQLTPKRAKDIALNNTVAYDQICRHKPEEKSLQPTLNTSLKPEDKDLESSSGNAKIFVQTASGPVVKGPNNGNQNSMAYTGNTSEKDSGMVTKVPMIVLPTNSNAHNCNSQTANTVSEKTVRPVVLNVNSSNTVEQKNKPVEMNSYTGTLLDGSYCDVLNVFRSPGVLKFHGTMSNISCDDLLKDKSVKGVWLKGVSEVPFVLKIANNFKNIKLVKTNGKIVYPTGISEFGNKGTVISYYLGQTFDVSFKDAVELIVFFKNVEKGDKVVVEKYFEATVK